MAGTNVQMSVGQQSDLLERERELFLERLGIKVERTQGPLNRVLSDAAARFVYIALLGVKSLPPRSGAHPMLCPIPRVPAP